MTFCDRAIAISATFTAEALEPALAFWMAELGFTHEVRFAPYNTLFQQLLDSNGAYAANRNGVNVALVRLEDWLPAGVDAQAGEFCAALESAARFAAPLIVALCPPKPGNDAAFAVATSRIRDAAAGFLHVHYMYPAEYLGLYPVENPHDPHGDELGHLPYTPLFFAALATAIARRVHALSTPPFKLIALDCDDTLWAGVCGEDGPEGVALDEHRLALQRFMAARRRQGFLLALASKNNEEDAQATFRSHPGMPLGWDDFTARRVNWQPKGENLQSIARELGLALSSFILVDDSAKECTEVQSSAPGALALKLPSDPTQIEEFLRHVWAFDRVRVTAEDLRRSELYQQQARRQQAERAAGTLEEFLASLELRVSFAPLTAATAPRVAQLTQRTNQMNATLRRRTETEIQALSAAGLECLTVEVEDRFGSYGLAGALIFSAAGGALSADTFLLSCRALGRGVEHRMVAKLGELATGRGLERVEIPFAAGERNRPARLFLESLGAPDAAGVFRFSAAAAAAARYQPASAAPAGEPESALPAEAPRRADYARIARQLRRPADVLERIRAASRRAASPLAAQDPPQTALEGELAALWASLLNVEAVGVHENFFELGGHSLLAVQLLSRVRQLYSVDLSLEVVYSGDFSVAELAKAVELKEMERSGADYQELLAELDGLSDEEVRLLLAEERDAG